MALRSVTVAGTPPLEVPLDENVSYVNSHGEELAGLIEALSAEGWVIASAEGVVGDDVASRLDRAFEGVVLGVEVADAFSRAVDEERSAAVAETERRRAAVSSVEAALDRVAELRDAVIDEVGHGAVLRSEATTRWERIWLLADQVGATDPAADLRRWLGTAEDGTAALHPLAIELIEASAALDARWDALGRGVYSDVTAVAAAREEREQLRALAVELESHVAGGVGERAAELIEEAHARRLRAEDGAPRSELTAARDAEERLLGGYGFDGYPDFQIARATGTFADHANAALPAVRVRLERASDEVAAALAEAEERGREVEADRADLAMRIDNLAGDGDLDELLATPGAAEVLLEWCAARAHALNAELTVLSSALCELAASIDALSTEASCREEEARAARRLRDELDVARTDLRERRAVAIERLETLLSDDANPGVVLRARRVQLEVEELAGIIDHAATQLVVVPAAVAAD